MAKLWPWEARAPNRRWPILGHKMAILATVFEIWTSNLFWPLFTLILIYKPSLESIRPKSAILFPKRLQKLTKVAISQNSISPKCHSPKSLLLLHFSTNLSETFRINVNMDFAHTNCGRFKIQKKPGFFWILGSNFFGGLNQKSATISMCKIHIYIDSESFRQIRWKM